MRISDLLQSSHAQGSLGRQEAGQLTDLPGAALAHALQQRLHRLNHAAAAAAAADVLCQCAALFAAAAARAGGLCTRRRGQGARPEEHEHLLQQVALAGVLEASGDGRGELRRGRRPPPQVVCREQHRDAAGAHLRLHRRREVRGQLALRLHPRREDLGDAGELAEAEDDAAGGDVGDVAAPVEGQQALLAQSGKGDVAHDDEAVGAGAHDGLVEERGAKGPGAGVREEEGGQGQ